MAMMIIKTTEIDAEVKTNTPTAPKFQVLENCLSVISDCILHEPFALLTEHFLRVRIITELCRRGIEVEENSRRGGRHSTFVSIANLGAQNERILFRVGDRSTINITPGRNTDIKVAGVDPCSIDLKCKGDFGSNSVLLSKICNDMDRAVGGVVDFFVLATTAAGFEALCNYSRLRNGESERFADAVPPLDQITPEGIDKFRGFWYGGAIAVTARRVTTSPDFSPS